MRPFLIAIAFSPELLACSSRACPNIYEPPISITVVDADTGAPICAAKGQISQRGTQLGPLDGQGCYTDYSGETSASSFGEDPNERLEPGSYDVTFTAPGYATQSVPLTLTDNGCLLISDVHQIEMMPSSSDGGT